MKREIYDADHGILPGIGAGLPGRQVKPRWDKYIEAKQFPREMWLGSCHGSHADTVAPQLVELTIEEQRPALAAGSECVMGTLPDACQSIGITRRIGGTDYATPRVALETSRPNPWLARYERADLRTRGHRLRAILPWPRS